MGRLRLKLAQLLQEKELLTIPVDQHEFLWVYDFPLFTMGEDRFEATHHPFTAPNEDDFSLLETDPARVRGHHYDLVLNGTEIGGGSIRIHSAALQEYVLRNIMQVRKLHL